MRRRVKRRGINLKTYLFKFGLPLIFLFLLIGSIWIIRAGYFTIKQIEFNLVKIDCAARQQIEKASDVAGKIIFSINDLQVENNLKKQFICVKEIDITKTYPNKLRLDVFGREAVAILVEIATESTSSAQLDLFSQTSSISAESTNSANINFSAGVGSESYLVDDEGIIFSKNMELVDIPKIYFSGLKLSFGQKIEQEIINNSLKILEKIKILGIIIKGAKIYSEDILLINSLPKMIFRLDKNIDNQLASLQLILEKAKIDQVSIEFIDLRFDNPVVKLAPKNKK